MHRNIKPANLVIDKGIYKIYDFGLSKIIDENKDQELESTGTPLYQAPEIWFQ